MLVFLLLLNYCFLHVVIAFFSFLVVVIFAVAVGFVVYVVVDVQCCECSGVVNVICYSCSALLMLAACSLVCFSYKLQHLSDSVLRNRPSLVVINLAFLHVFLSLLLLLLCYVVAMLLLFCVRRVALWLLSCCGVLRRKHPR